VESLVGTTIGGYKVDRAIGTGTVGQTYGAMDSAGTPVAIKVLHPALSLFTRVQSYWEELQRLGELAHPHIVVPSAADWSMSGRFFLAMELLEGLDLDQALARHGRLSPAQVLLFAGQACLALEAVHQVGKHHGALKPRNIYLIPRGTDPSRLSTRVTDFASSHLVDTAKIPDAALGSPGVPDGAYLAPEQFNGKAGPAADVYALGVVLYEALSGRRPFTGSYDELAEQHAKARLEVPSTIPGGLDEIVVRAMAKKPAARYPDVARLREALEGWASASPPELKQAPVALFPKEGAAVGVGEEEQLADQTVRVPVEEIAAVFDEDTPEAATKELKTVDTEDKTRPPAPQQEQPSAEPAGGKPEAPEDEELAAIAARAGAALRKELAGTPEPEPPPPEPEPTEVEGFFDEDGELVELPLEKSVRAFVASISPSVPRHVPAPVTRPGGNGESLDLALDNFMREAKAWSAALPPPAIDDKSLAELAKVPVEPEPEPEPEPPKPAPQPIAMGEPPPRRSVAVPVAIAFVFGGLIVFAVVQFLLPTIMPKPTPPPVEPTPLVQPTVQPDTAAPVATPLADVAPVATGTVDGGGEPAAPDAAAAAAAATLDAAPATPPKPPVAVKRKPVRKRPRKIVKRPRRPKPRKPKPKRPPAAKRKPSTSGSEWKDPFSQ
jgi:hypothetical protein